MQRVSGLLEDTRRRGATPGRRWWRRRPTELLGTVWRSERRGSGVGELRPKSFPCLVLQKNHIHRSGGCGRGRGRGCAGSRVPGHANLAGNQGMAAAAVGSPASKCSRMEAQTRRVERGNIEGLVGFVEVRAREIAGGRDVQIVLGIVGIVRVAGRLGKMTPTGGPHLSVRVRGERGLRLLLGQRWAVPRCSCGREGLGRLGLARPYFFNFLFLFLFLFCFPYFLYIFCFIFPNYFKLVSKIF